MYAHPVVAPQRRTSGYATASLTLGIVGVFLGWCTFGLPSLLAIVLGHMALNDIRTKGFDGRGAAKIGLTLGYAMMTVTALGIFGWISSMQ